MPLGSALGGHVSDRVAYTIISLVVGIWALQSIAGMIDPARAPDPLLTGAVGSLLSVVITVIVATKKRNGNGAH